MKMGRLTSAILIFISVSIILTGGCSSGESYVQEGYNFSNARKVAILDVTGAVINQAAQNQIADFFVMELMKKGFAPVERTQVQALLEEQNFQATDVTSQQGMAKAGEVLNVPAVMIINIPEFGDTMSFTAKMLEVQTASIIWVGSGEGSTGKWLSTIGGAAAGAAAGAAVSGDDDQVIGAVAGGALGGVAGHALAPKKAKQARKVITKICESLPSIR